MKYIQIITILLILTFALFCKGASLGMIGHSMHMVDVIDHTKTTCCAEDIGGGEMAAHHDITIALTDMLLLVTLMSVIFAGIVQLCNYYKIAIPDAVQQRLHDPPRLYYYLQRYISCGLLHPKIF